MDNALPVAPLCDIVVEYAQSLECTLTLECGYGYSAHLLELPNGLLASSRNQAIKVWDLATGTIKSKLWGHRDTVTALAATSDGRIISSARDRKIVEWSAAGQRITQKEWKTLEAVVHIPQTGELAFSRENNNVYVGELWRNLPRLTLRHQNKVTGLVLLPKNRLASGSKDKTIRVWDLQAGTCLRTLKGHASPVEQLVLAPNGKLVSLSTDCELRVWDVDAGVCVRSVVYPQVKSISGCSDGCVLMCATTCVSIWNPESHKDPVVIERCASYFKNAIALSDGRVATWLGSKVKIWE